MFRSRSKNGANSSKACKGTDAEDADILALRSIREAKLLESTSSADDAFFDFSDFTVHDTNGSSVLSLSASGRSNGGYVVQTKTAAWRQRLRDLMGRQSSWKLLTKLASKGEDGLRAALEKMKSCPDKSINDSCYRKPENGQNLFHYLLKEKNVQGAAYVLNVVEEQPFLVHHFDVTVNKSDGKRNALHQIVQLGDVTLARRLIGRVTNGSFRQALLYGETPVEMHGQRPRTLPPLMLAAYFGHDELIRFLVEDMGVPVDSTNSKKDTALMFAARWNHVEAVKLLLSQGAWPDKANDTGATALYWAARYGHLDSATCLIRDGRCDVNVKRNSGFRAPIILAAALGFDAICKLLLTAGADVHVQDEGGATALHHAAREGHLHIIDLLLPFGARMDDPDKQGDTALLLAARHGHAQVLKTLITLGSDFTVSNHRGEDMWYLAINSDHQYMLKLAVLLHRRLEFLYSFKDAGADDLVPDEKLPTQTQMPLLLAATLGRSDKMTTLLDLGVDAQATDQSGNSFLHLAGLHNHDGVIETFCPKQLGPNHKNNRGDTPLHCACATGSDEVVLALLKCKASADVRNNDGQICLHMIHRLKAATVKSLIDYTIKSHSWTDINTQDENGNTPLHLAAAMSSPDVLWEFRVLGCHETANKDGNTAMHLSVRENEHEVLGIMLDLYQSSHQRRSDLNAKNAKGLSVLMLAARARQTANVQRLLQLGCDVAIQDSLGNSLLHDVTTLTVSDASHRDHYLQILDAVWNNTVKWWCLKSKTRIPEFGSKDYVTIKRDAIFFLTRQVINNEKMNVLKHACRIGAQHVIRCLLDMPDVTSYLDHVSGVKMYDVTDLLPMTCVSQRQNARPNTCPDDQRAAVSRKSCLELILSNRSVHHSSQMLDIMPLSQLQSIYGHLTCRVYALFLVLHILYMAIFNWTAMRILRLNTEHWEGAGAETGPGASGIFNTTVPTLTYTAMAASHSTVHLPAVAEGGGGEGRGNNSPGNVFVLTEPEGVVLIAVVPIEPVFILLYYIYLLFTRCWKSRLCTKRYRTAGHRAQRALRTCLEVTFSLGFAGLVAASVGLLLVGYRHAEYVVAAALAYGWMYSMSFTRAFRPIHCYWSMIQQMVVSDIFRCMVLFLFVILAFTFAFHAVFMGSGGVAEMYTNPLATMFYVFNLMLGMSDVIEDGVEEGMEESGKGVLFIQVLYSLYMITAHIILLNLLIAMLNDSYSSIRELQEVTWKVEVVQMGITLADSIPLSRCLSGRINLTKGTLTPASGLEHKTLISDASSGRPAVRTYSSVSVDLKSSEKSNHSNHSKLSSSNSSNNNANMNSLARAAEHWVISVPLDYDRDLGPNDEGQEDDVTMEALMEKVTSFENNVSDQMRNVEHALNAMRPKRRFFWQRKSVLNP